MGGRIKGGVNSTIYTFPSVNLEGQNIQIEKYGAVMYLSSKTRNSLFAQLYLMGGRDARYQEFELVHSEEDSLINYLQMQGASVNGLVYYQGVRGPIKVWKANYDEDVLVNEEFLSTSGKYAEFDNLTFRK